MRRILIVGAGSIGLKHVRAFSSLDRPPHIYVLEPDERAQRRAEELGARLLKTDWESTEIGEFDGVVICAPPRFHVPYAARCIAEGVPVLSEKPLSRDWEGVENLVELASRPGAPASGVAYTRRYIPAHEAIRERIVSGEFGRIHVLRICAGQPFTTYRPDYREIYYASRSEGGGCTLDFASHFLDLAEWYLGPIDSIKGYARHLALEGVEVDDTVACSFEFSSGALGSLHVNQFQPVNENVIDLCGMDASLRVVEPEFEASAWRKGCRHWENLQLPAGDYFDGLKNQAAAFLSAIEGGPPMQTSIADAARGLRLCLDLLETAGGDSNARMPAL